MVRKRWAGWRALGRPDTDVEERELSDGQLRMRVRAMERENAWQPRYVARELSGTTQAAENERECGFHFNGPPGLRCSNTRCC